MVVRASMSRSRYRAVFFDNPYILWKDWKTKKIYRKKKKKNYWKINVSTSWSTGIQVSNRKLAWKTLSTSWYRLRFYLVNKQFVCTMILFTLNNYIFVFRMGFVSGTRSRFLNLFVLFNFVEIIAQDYYSIEFRGKEFRAKIQNSPAHLHRISPWRARFQLTIIN